MTTLYRFDWRQDNAMTYTHGSQLSFSADGSVSLTNALIAPGQALRTWRNLRPKESPHEQMRLPFLTPGVAYQLQGDWTATPDGTVGLQADTFDEDGQRLAHHVVNDHELTFTYDDDACDYQVALVNMSMQTIEFRQLLFGAEADLAQYAVTPLTPEIVAVKPWDAAEQLPLAIVLQPQQVPIQALPAASDREQLVVSVPLGASAVAQTVQACVVKHYVAYDWSQIQVTATQQALVPLVAAVQAQLMQ
jgi:accessory Sec system protein Asp3